MGTPFSAVYETFLRKITDFGMMQEYDDVVEKELYGYMLSAIPKFKKIKSDLGKRNLETLSFEDELLDVEVEILALQMVGEWIEPQLNSNLYTQQFFGTKDERFFNQRGQIEMLMALKRRADNDARMLRRDYSMQKLIS